MTPTSERLLDAAQALVQRRGFNAFSFRDLASRLGITNAGIHYHFPKKADLGRALIARYRRNVAEALTEVDRTAGSAMDRLKGFVAIYADGLRKERLCLGIMLASETITLPDEVQDEVRSFFAALENWLTRVLEDGRTAGEFHFEGAAEDEAALVLSTVEGAMLSAWPLRSRKPAQALARFETVMQRFLDGLTPS
ncbi:TetR/AcrR family transcriptional regulator [Rhodocaloribacter sp.]